MLNYSFTILADLLVRKTDLKDGSIHKKKHRIIHFYADLFIIQYQNRSSVKQENERGNRSSDQSTSHHIKSTKQIADQNRHRSSIPLFPSLSLHA